MNKQTNNGSAASGFHMTTLQSGLVWFGAGVSIAEILTGTYLAPLGFRKGLAAILTGHLIGCLMMYFAGIIGGLTRRSAMETTRMSFGRIGGVFFALLNILQLVGWTAIMIYDGAGAINKLYKAGIWVWALVIGGMILLWILVGLTNLGWINWISMTALFILTLLLSGVIFGHGILPESSQSSISFGAAVELSVAMPLSWLPLISDYTREAESPRRAALVSVLVYGLVSIWMYMIGLGAALFTGQSDIAGIMAKAGLGIAALVILILSTVTTTFLDAWSAGISTESLGGFLHGKGKRAAAIVTIIGTLGAALFNMDDITDFLYLIGSVFAPMIAIQIADYFILKKDHYTEKINLRNLIVWVIGFVLYHILMTIDLPLGNTLPDMLLTILICLLAQKFA